MPSWERVCPVARRGASTSMNVSVSVFERLARGIVCGAIAAALLVASGASAADPVIITSATKQFVVRGAPQRSLLTPGPSSETVYLDPALLVVTCEMVKRELQRELGWGGRWSATVYINIHPIRFDNEAIRVNVSRNDNRWRYHLEMPDEISRRELLRTLVEVLLVEFADRAASDQSVELPPWLAEGLTEHLVLGPLAGAAMQAKTLDEIRSDPGLLAARTVRRGDASQKLRETVQREGALSFDQLNWLEFDENDEQTTARYRYSAHLFVRELLRLRGGPDCICAMLAMLPEHLNWQMAFLRGFSPHFQRMLDVEKWWSLNLAQWKTRDSAITWAPAEARRKLDEILNAPLRVQVKDGGSSHVASVALQTVIKDWAFEEQVALLKAKITQLQAARLHLPAAFASLSDSYRVTIEKYLQARGTAWFDATGRAAANRAVLELDALDAQRAQLAGKILAIKSPEAAPLTPP